MTIRSSDHAFSRRAFLASTVVLGVAPSFAGTVQGTAGGGEIGPIGTQVPAPPSVELDTERLISALASRPTVSRQRTIDRFIKRLNAEPELKEKILYLWLIGADDQASLVDWRDPTRRATRLEGTRFTADDAFQASSKGAGIDFGVLASSLDPNDHSMFVWSNDATASMPRAPDMGAIDADGDGISISAYRWIGQNIGVRSAGSAIEVSQPGSSDGYGLSGFSRQSADTVVGYRLGVRQDTVSSPAGSLPALAIHGCGTNRPGNRATFSAIGQSAWIIGRGMNDRDVTLLNAFVSEYLEALRHGEISIEELGVGAASIRADCVAYGFTGQSILFALQAARNGKSVAIIGGWRDRRSTIGGMSAAGLGLGDIDRPDALGGLPRYVISRINAIAGKPDDRFAFEPKHCRAAFLELLDASRNGGFEIPLFVTNGVTAVTKVGSTIRSFSTTDGRLVTGTQFFDGSYEGDLALRAGCSNIVGREAAGNGPEANNGYDNSPIDFGIDPWNEPGNSASGLIPDLHGVASVFTPALNTESQPGAADDKTQAYNFRLTMTKDPRYRVRPELEPPSGFDLARLEKYLRAWGKNGSRSFLAITKADALNGGPKYDINNRSLPPYQPSTDIPGMSWRYPLADYAERERIWQEHKDYTAALFWLARFGTDPRIPMSLRIDARQWGMASDHYDVWHENDGPNTPPQLYVREGMRLIGDAILTGNDLVAEDGTAPRISTKTVTVASYMMDSHATRHIAYEKAPGLWTTLGEGGLGSPSGDHNRMAPIPLEIVVPKASEATNLSVGFCVSSTHVAFGSIRMEFTAWQIGQTMGQMAARAIDDESSLQAVDYDTARASLMAGIASLPGERAPVLPQVS